jgi:hypothetical protein
MTNNPDELDQPLSDQGVPVGEADVEEDRRNAADDERSTDDETWTETGAMEERSDQGVPVGQDDVDADRRNAAD